MVYIMNLAEKIQLLRQEKGETQQDLADILGGGVSTIKTYENKSGERKPDIDRLKILKEHYGVSYEYLLDDDCQNRTNKTIDIGKELLLSEKAIKRIKDLQPVSIPVTNKNETLGFYTHKYNVGFPEAFSRFLESDIKFDYLIREIKAIQDFTDLYKNVATFLYIIYLTDLIINNTLKKEIFEYYDKLINEINEIIKLYPFFYEESKSHTDFLESYNEFKDSCNINEKNIGVSESDYNNERGIFIEYILSFLTTISTQLTCNKYRLIEYITTYLSFLTEPYQIDDFGESKNCFDDTIRKFLKKLEDLKNK